VLTGDANADGETEIEVCFFISADLGGVIKHGLGDEALGISISFFSFKCTGVLFIDMLFLFFFNLFM